MKKTLFMLALFVVAGWAQNTVKAIPSYHEGQILLNTTSYNDSATTSAISARQWDGAATLFLQLDTAAAQTVQDINVYVQLKDSTTWYDDYSDWKIATVGSAKWADTDVYINLGNVASRQWSVADSVRFIIGSQSVQGTVKVRIAGQ